MIKHIVMWKLKDEYESQNKNVLAQEMKKRLEALKGLIAEVVEIEVGINEFLTPQAFDIVLYTEFKSEDDLNTYQKHPEHLKVVDYIKQVTTERIFVDYTV